MQCGNGGGGGVHVCEFIVSEHISHVLMMRFLRQFIVSLLFLYIVHML